MDYLYRMCIKAEKKPGSNIAIFFIIQIIFISVNFVSLIWFYCNSIELKKKMHITLSILERFFKLDYISLYVVYNLTI
jgi:hypothetical protein